VRAAVTALLWLGTLAILSGQLIAVAWVLNAVLGAPKWAGCLAGGAVMTIYFAAGGLQSAVVVNAMQLVLELVVFASLVPLALAAAGGLERVVALAPQDPGYWNFFSGGSPASSTSRCSRPPSSSRPDSSRRSTRRATTAPCAGASG